MTQDFYGYSRSSTTNAVCAGPRNIFISTMSFSVLTVETTFARTFSPSAGAVTTAITSIVRTASVRG